MRYLLDTHTAIWALEQKDKAKLSEKARIILEDTSISLFVSLASAWEIAIKTSTEKLKFNGGSESFIKKMQENDIIILGIDGTHIKGVETLPFIHRDPFDRLLIATAQAENMTIVTIDDNIQKYDVSWVW